MDQKLLFEDCIYEHSIGNWFQARAGLESLAADNHVEATCFLANMYLRGEAVPANAEVGVGLLRKAVTLGSSTAAYSLGALYRSGDCSVPKNAELSKQYFRIAAEIGTDLPVAEFLK